MDIKNIILSGEYSKLGAILIVILILIITLYILYTLAILALSKHAGEKKYRYLAWLPQFNMYYTYKLGFGNPLAFILFILSVLSSNISLTINEKVYTTANILPENIKSIINIILLIFTLTTIVKLYKQYSKNYIIYTILTILSLGLLTPVFLFVIRNNQRIQMDISLENINTNANEYFKINEITSNKSVQSPKIQPKIEEEYDIGNSWDGPK